MQNDECKDSGLIMFGDIVSVCLLIVVTFYIIVW